MLRRRYIWFPWARSPKPTWAWSKLETSQTWNLRPQTWNLSFKLETWGLKLETWGLKLGTWALELETWASNLKLEASNLKPEASNLKLEASRGSRNRAAASHVRPECGSEAWIRVLRRYIPNRYIRSATTMCNRYLAPLQCCLVMFSTVSFSDV